MGICSCRHEKLHLGTKKCDVSLELCCSFDHAADFLIRRHLAREVSKEQMVMNLDRARELGLVMNADNVRKNASFICLCCACCCNALAGLKVFGYANVVISTGGLSLADVEKCTGCGACARVCPVEILKMVPDDRLRPSGRNPRRPTPLFVWAAGCAP